MADMTPLSSTLNRNFHLGAQDTRRFVWSNLANDWLPTSWQESITQLSYSVTGLWDSVIRAIELVF